MDTTCKEESESSSEGVFEIPGEPAIVINGVPNMTLDDSSSIHHDIASDKEAKDIPGFGEWLEGREVRKLFGEQYYSGKVVKFDRETNWYRVVYEDGDFEDLEWRELQEVLVPLDIAIPLESLALKSEISVIGSGENTAEVRKGRTKNVWTKSKTGRRIKANVHCGKTSNKISKRPRDLPTLVGKTDQAESQRRRKKNTTIEKFSTEAKA
eukprot:TRINITY_DN4427_c0_g1_i1.p1 TRINITY_DN4427_c0_g1~~TRINITY_DN4427_c0_g1_i1.p1  ORF type:complete len:220 (-),score=50.63 TRINITY_DN4427_c0_g1_i1:602-1231(-)